MDKIISQDNEEVVGFEGMKLYLYKIEEATVQIYKERLDKLYKESCVVNTND